MRLHITLEDDLVAALDRRTGKRQRSSYIVALIKRALEDEQRWDEIESALDSIPDQGHAWDDDPGTWVQSQRRSDRRRTG